MPQPLLSSRQNHKTVQFEVSHHHFRISTPLTCTEHASRFRQAITKDHTSTSQSHFDQAIYWRAEYTFLQKEFAKLQDERNDLKCANEAQRHSIDGKQHSQALECRPQRKRTKKRHHDGTFASPPKCSDSATAVSPTSTPTPRRAAISSPMVNASHTDTLSRSSQGNYCRALYESKLTRAGRALLCHVFDLQSLYRDTHPNAMQIARKIEQCTIVATKCLSLALDETRDVDATEHTITVLGRIFALCLYPFDALEQFVDGQRHLRNITFHLVTLFSSVLDHLVSINDKFVQEETESNISAAMTRHPATSTDEAQGQIKAILHLLCTFISSLSTQKTTHAPVVEGCLYTVLKRLEKCLFTLTFKQSYAESARDDILRNTSVVGPASATLIPGPPTPSATLAAIEQQAYLARAQRLALHLVDLFARLDKLVPRQTNTPSEENTRFIDDSSKGRTSCTESMHECVPSRSGIQSCPKNTASKDTILQQAATQAHANPGTVMSRRDTTPQTIGVQPNHLSKAVHIWPDAAASQCQHTHTSSLTADLRRRIDKSITHLVFGNCSDPGTLETCLRMPRLDQVVATQTRKDADLNPRRRTEPDEIIASLWDIIGWDILGREMDLDDTPVTNSARATS